MSDIEYLRERAFTRRHFLRAAAATGGVVATGGVLAACSPSPNTSPSSAASGSPSAATVAPSASAAAGPVTLAIWSQDYGPLNDLLDIVKTGVEGNNPGVTLDIKLLAYEELGVRFIPSIAAGTEADVMLADYTWLRGSDISKLFTPFVPEVMSKDDATRLYFAPAMAEVSVGDQIFVAPTGNGGGGSVWTYNAAILEAAGIDLSSIETWDDFVAVGKDLTQRQGDDITRSGIAISDGINQVALAWVTGILQLGGQWFDAQTGSFNLTSAEAIQALRNLDDLVKVHKVDTFSKTNGAPEAFEKGLSVFSNVGSWMVAGFAESTPDFKAGILPTPKMGSASDALVPSGGGGFVMSRRLKDDPAKRAAAKLFVQEITSPAAAGDFVDLYSAAIAMRTVAEDPQVQQTRRYGYIQKQYSELMWPRLSTTPHQVPDWHGAIAFPALERVFRNSEPIETVLKELQDQSNQLEKDARDRLGL